MSALSKPSEQKPGKVGRTVTEMMKMTAPSKELALFSQRRQSTLKKHAVIIVSKLPSTEIKGSIGIKAYRFELAKNTFRYEINGCLKTLGQSDSIQLCNRN